MTFTCPTDGAFDSNAKLRAACPKCGKTIKRFATEPEPKPEPVQEKEDTEEKSEEEEEVKAPDPPTKKVLDPVKRIKVVAKKKQPETIRKVVSKKPIGSKPIIKTKVRTNVEKKASKESGDSDTTWNQIRKSAWF